MALPVQFKHANLPQDRPDPLDGPAKLVDRATGAAFAQLTGGLSPASIAAAFVDWRVHLAAAPGRQMHLAAKAVRKSVGFGDYSVRAVTKPDNAKSCIKPLAHDHRIDDPAWRRWPFDFIQQNFLLGQQWWDAAASGVGGVTAKHEAVVRFAMRQMLDTVAPTNFIATNPVVQQHIPETGGKCLLDGASRCRAHGGRNGASGLPIVRLRWPRFHPWVARMSVTQSWRMRLEATSSKPERKKRRSGGLG